MSNPDLKKSTVFKTDAVMKNFLSFLQDKRYDASPQGWPNHCPGAKKCPPRHFQVPFKLF